MKTTTILAILVAFVLAPFSARATVQARDSITLDGKPGKLDEVPFGDYPGFKRIEFRATSTGNYRGFVCRWKIDVGKLYLTEFEGNVVASNRIAGLLEKEGMRDLKWLFPKSRGPVFADWYTGPLTVSLGEPVLIKMHGHIVVTESLAVLQVEKGVVKTKRLLRYPANIPVINRKASEFHKEPIDVTKLPY